MRAALLPVLLAVSLAGCAGWPPEGRGGFAERRSITEPALEQAAQQFQRQRRDGAEQRAAGLSDEARLLFIRAQRNHAAGLDDDFSHDLARLRAVLAAIDTLLKRS